MSTTTENYGLKKPEQEDFYNIDDFNENADIIDTQLKTLSDEVKKAAQNDEVTQVNQKVGSTADSGGSSTAGSIFAKLNKVISDIATHMGRWTSTRAGYIDTINTNTTNAKNYTVTNNTANKTGVLSQKLSYLINLLENGTYGLSALKSNGISAVKSVQHKSGIMPGDVTTLDITISSVNSSKSFISFSANGNGTSAGFIPVGVFKNNTTITLTRIDSGSSNWTCSYAFDVVEFY